MLREIYKPTETQRRFHDSAAKFRIYEGELGSGKTISGCAEAVRMALLYPGSWGLVGRFSWKDLNWTTWDTLTQMLPDEARVERDRVTFPSGSRIYGVSLSDPECVRSLVLDWFFLDEAGEFPDERVAGLLASRLRHSVGPHRGWMAGSRYGWEWLEKLEGIAPYAGSLEIITATARENPHIPIEVVEIAERLARGGIGGV